MLAYRLFSLVIVFHFLFAVPCIAPVCEPLLDYYHDFRGVVGSCSRFCARVCHEGQGWGYSPINTGSCYEIGTGSVACYPKDALCDGTEVPGCCIGRNPYPNGGYCCFSGEGCVEASPPEASCRPGESYDGRLDCMSLCDPGCLSGYSEDPAGPSESKICLVHFKQECREASYYCRKADGSEIRGNGGCCVSNNLIPKYCCRPRNNDENPGIEPGENCNSTCRNGYRLVTSPSFCQRCIPTCSGGYSLRDFPPLPNEEGYQTEYLDCHNGAIVCRSVDGGTSSSMEGCCVHPTNIMRKWCVRPKTSFGSTGNQGSQGNQTNTANQANNANQANLTNQPTSNTANQANVSNSQNVVNLGGSQNSVLDVGSAGCREFPCRSETPIIVYYRCSGIDITDKLFVLSHITNRYIGSGISKRSKRLCDFSAAYLRQKNKKAELVRFRRDVTRALNSIKASLERASIGLAALDPYPIISCAADAPCLKTNHAGYLAYYKNVNDAIKRLIKLHSFCLNKAPLSFYSNQMRETAATFVQHKNLELLRNSIKNIYKGIPKEVYKCPSR